MKKPISTGKIIDFADYLGLTPIKTFVETGTCFGRTVKTALDIGYQKVISVEAHDDFYNQCATKFKGDNRVRLFHGKSTEMLPAMFAEFKGVAVFWLDAHPSGPQTAGHFDLMEKGADSEFNQDTILSKEIKLILETGYPHVIIIDDQNGYTDSVKSFINIFEKWRPGGYKFQFADEQMGENFYKDKILVCLPTQNA